MADEGVHEIQLNGKQLVFMFMAVTVVAVVIFLCGVMVGRGVRAPRAADIAETTTEAPADPTAVVQPPASTEASASTTATAAGSGAPVTTQEKLTYADRLSSSTSPPETLRSEPIAPAAAPAEAPATAKVPVADAKPASKAAAKSESKTDAKAESKAESKVAAAESSDAAGGFVVQVAAVKARSEADTIAKRLSSKGFPSYVTTPGPGAAHVYRVRVGKYTDRREAESVARRLEKEEQFKPWITR
jgi:DedD protein